LQWFEWQNCLIFRGKKGFFQKLKQEKRNAKVPSTGIKRHVKVATEEEKDFQCNLNAS